MPVQGRYCTQGDIVPSLVTERAVAQIATGDPSASTIDADVEVMLGQWVEDAESEVDGYLSQRYALPLPRVPTLVKRLSARITRFRVYTSRPGSAEEWLTDDYKRAVSDLEKIAKGEMGIGLAALGADPGASAAAGVLSSSTAPVFGRNNMRGY